MTRIETATLVGAAQRNAAVNPRGRAFVHLADGTEEAASFTFAEFDATARRIASGLLEHAKPGDTALLIYEAGVDFVAALFGCLYARVIGVPIAAPEASRLKANLPRIENVARDCKAEVLLGNARTHEMLAGFHQQLPSIRRDCWLDTQTLPGDATREFAEPDADSLAYLQYTSGSTSTPKGVMVSHRNTVEHLAGMREMLDYGPDSVSVAWMPHFHDYALIEALLLPVSNGTPSYIMSPFAFLKRPASWLDAIAKYGGTHTQAQNFAYRFATQRVTEEQKERINLSTLVSAGNGGEPIRPDTTEQFYQAFARCGLRRQALRHVFGLAEATLLVSNTRHAEARNGCFDSAALAQGKVVPAEGGEGSTLVASCGAIYPLTEVAIVDAATCRRAAANEIGEVWVSSPGVAQGYWKRPEESDATFRAAIVGEGGAYLRTGDLGFLHDGELYISGRAKDMIIIRGENIYPSDIEWTVQNTSPLLRGDNGAAFGIAEAGEERLCVVQEIERVTMSDEELDALCTQAARAVAEVHGVSLHSLTLIRRGSIPKTSSGKIQRSACRRGFLDGSLKVVKQWPERTVPAARQPGKSESARKADELIAWLRHYFERRVNSRLIDERRCVPPNVIMDLGNRGVFGLQAPAQFGGMELSSVDTMRVLEQLGAADLTLATLVFLHITNGTRPLLRFASEEVKNELLPILASGRELAAFALSEPGAGTNLALVSSTAVPQPDGSWRISGSKRWNGTAWAGVISVFARTLDERGRPRGLAGFVVRTAQEGVTVGPESLTMGVRGIMQNSIDFDNVHVPATHVLGEPGRGMQVVEYTLSHGRLSMAAVSVGGMERCAQLILRYARRRPIDTGLLIDNPQAAAKISELLHRTAIERELVRYAAARLDAGREISPDVSMSMKASATSGVYFAADLLMQLLGGRGFMENNIAPQIFRDARMLTIGEGANEGMNAAVGRSARMSEEIHTYLTEWQANDLSARLKAVSATLDGIASVFSGSAARAWHDALLGELTGAALAVAAARSLQARGEADAATLEWAQERFARMALELERGDRDPVGLLSTDRIISRTEALGALIGDLEPLAPDVDYVLDPLLRRDAPLAEKAPTAAPSTAGPDLTNMSADEKRAALRKLLRERNRS